MTQYRFNLAIIHDDSIEEVSSAVGSAEEVAAFIRMSANRLDPDPMKQAGKSFAEEILGGLRGSRVVGDS